MTNPSDEERKVTQRLEAARERLARIMLRTGQGPLTPEQEAELAQAKDEVEHATRALKGVMTDIASGRDKGDAGT
jgi:acyl-CoA reductase-like NAD-dependent aldehyde dehydrogenase